MDLTEKNNSSKDTKYLNVRLLKDDHQKLRFLAVKKMTTIQKMVRECIQDLLKNHGERC